MSTFDLTSTYTNRDRECKFRILELFPAHYDAACCTLCGQFGENVNWYWTTSPEAFNTHTAVHAALLSVAELFGVQWPDDNGYPKWPHGGATLSIAVNNIVEEIDPIAFQHCDGDLTVCTDCVKASSAELRRRIRKHADQLDEAGYWAPYGPDSDDLADPDLRDRGLWVRRHVGYELALVEECHPGPNPPTVGAAS